MSFYSDDEILELLINLKYPISRGDKSVKEFLYDYYNKFIGEYKNILNSKNDITSAKSPYLKALEKALPMVEGTTRSILEVLEYYDEGKMTNVLNTFNALMDRIENSLYIKILNSNDELHNMFYRIRCGEQGNRKDLFHIPVHKRYLIKAGRYSIPGFPCLYLATGLTLCWIECEMPVEFSCSAFKLSRNEIKLIDFGYSPFNIADRVSIRRMNKASDDEINSALVRYLVTYPLQVACSFKVNDHNASFIEEYIVPQLLLLWVRENGNYDGILYKSSAQNEMVKSLGFLNLVLPAKRIEDDYCLYLNDLFLVSKPKYRHIGNYFRDHDLELSEEEGKVPLKEVNRLKDDINFFGNIF